MGSVEGILVRDPVATFRADVMCKEGLADRRRGDRIAQGRKVQRYFFLGKVRPLSFGVMGGGWERGSR